MTESNEDYTTDALGVHGSPSKGNGMRTVPFTLRFEPNCKYVIGFFSQGSGTIIIRNGAGSEVPLSEAM